jgi:hypothetical protein
LSGYSHVAGGPRLVCAGADVLPAGDMLAAHEAYSDLDNASTATSELSMTMVW